LSLNDLNNKDIKSTELNINPNFEKDESILNNFVSDKIEKKVSEMINVDASDMINDNKEKISNYEKEKRMRQI